MPHSYQTVFKQNSRKSLQIVAFVDPAINHYDRVVQRISKGTEIAILDPDQDHFEQIATMLRRRPEIKAVHIFSKRSPGHLYVSNTQLQLSVTHYPTKLSNWSPLLAVIDLFLHGCNFAGGTTGATFLEKLRHLSYRRESASVDHKGVLIGTWNLEVKIGEIEVPAIAHSEFR